MGFSLPASDGCSGQQVYLPPAPDCVCGHAEVVHELYAGKRRRCCAGGSKGRCDCVSYYPAEES